MLVYVITCIITGLLYIGITCLPIETRWGYHVRAARKGSNSYLHRAIRKHGPEKFTIKPLIIVGSKDEMDSYERGLIRAFNTKVPNGYNMTDGGEGLYNPSLETRAKLSAAATGYKHSDAARAKMSAAQKGRKPLSLEARAKISNALTGRKLSPETRKRLSENWNHPPVSAEIRRKQSEASMLRTPEERSAAAQKAGRKRAEDGSLARIFTLSAGELAALAKSRLIRRKRAIKRPGGAIGKALDILAGKS